MKKFHLAVIAVIGAATLVGCGNSTPKADLKNDVDTLSYACGLAQSRGLREFLTARMDVDTAYIDQFIKGLNAAINAGGDKKKAAYNAGLQIGSQIGNQMIPGINGELFDGDTTRTISVKNFMAGFISGVKGENKDMTQEEAMDVYRTKHDQVLNSVLEEHYASNKEAGEKFLAANAKKQGVVTLPSGVQYKVLKEGKGELPVDTSVVSINYEGRLINDTIFDSSYKKGTPVKLSLNRVIAGWTDALKHMPVGSEWEIYIPQDMAYGARKQAKIDPFSVLIFKVELLSIENK